MPDHFEPFMQLKNTWLITSDRIAQVSLAFLPNFTQNLMLIRCAKTYHSFLRRDVEIHTTYQIHNFHTTGVNALES
jgi:hypothetical protein